jgi:hypothetical protein
MDARDRGRDAEPVGEGDGREPSLDQVPRGGGEGRVGAGAVLDLAGDQLAREARGKLGVGRGVELLVAVDEVEPLRIEQLVLLLDADGEIGRGIEALGNSGEQGCRRTRQRSLP